ncbi:MAG: hypothetical protein JWO15_3684 [Sphingomonadales bacterium]|nr:hypothetical protein [Sphingomonadales bacterium]
MSSTTHNQTVQIDIIADAKKFREELKKASSDANAFNKGMKDVKKAGGRQDKDLAKLAKDANKFNKSAAKESIDYEKKLLSLIKQRQSEMKKISNQNSSDFKQKRKEAAEAASLYSDLRSNRAKASGSGQRGIGSKIGRGAYNGLVGGALGIGGLAIGALTARIGKAGDAATGLFSSGINLAGDKSIQSKRELMDITKQGASAGYDPMDTSAQAAAMYRATGRGNDVVHGQMFARAGAMDMGQATSFMGLQAKGGSDSTSQKKDLEKILTLAFANGLEKGRFGEYLEGLSSLVEGALGRESGDVNGAGYAKSLAQLDSTGQSGMRGSRGAKVLAQLEQGFMSGGGAAGQALSLSAMGYGTPGGNTSYYDAKKSQQEGFSNPDNMNKMLSNLKYRYGGNTEAAALAGSEQTGLTLKQMETLLKMDSSSPEMKKELEKLAEESIPLEQQMADVLKGELSDQAKIQSGRQQQLVEQGSLVVDSLNSLQDSTNQMIDKFWPVAVKSLEIIAKTVDVVAQAVTDSYDFWKSIDMFSTDKSDMTPGELARETSEQLAKDVTRQVKTGMLDEATGLSMLKSDRDSNRALSAKTGEAVESAKYSLAADESSKAVTNMINSRGGDNYTRMMMEAQAKQAEENRQFKEREESRRSREAELKRVERDRIAALPQGVSLDEAAGKLSNAADKLATVTPKAPDRTSPTLQRQ